MVYPSPYILVSREAYVMAAQVSCVVCEGKVVVPDSVLVGEILTCPDCGSDLEVTSLDPLKVEEAPEIQEDWGE
jgi:alpha-aminoadipate carrier protein LysW